MTPNATPIGQTLIHLGLISKDQLHIALREQGRRDRPAMTAQRCLLFQPFSVEDQDRPLIDMAGDSRGACAARCQQ